jgi:tripartite-type tricarboxylate transporter receptor subunit TctC
MKLLHRRQFLHLTAGAAALPAVSRFAWAQAYPTRPVRVVVGFPPGGVSDLSARLIGQWLSERLGQQFIVENRPGAGGALSTDTVAKAAPDGYTIALNGSNDAWNVSLYDHLNFSYLRDIVPVAGVLRGAGVVVVQPSSPSKTVADLITNAKANPGRISIGSGGVGSASHVFLELFKAMAGVDMVHVPYRGEAPALTDLLGGQLQAVIPTLPPAIEYIKAGRLRALAVTAATRLEALPDTPTIADTVPSYEGSFWIGIGAPRNTPTEIIDRLNREINAGLADTRIKQRLAELGVAGFAISPNDFGKFIVEFTDKWGKVIRAANIKPE